MKGTLVLYWRSKETKKLYANLSKYEFWMDEVKFLGQVVSKREISVDPNKVEAMMN